MKKIVCVFLCIMLLAVCCSCSGIPLNNRRFSRSFTDLFDTVSTVTAYDSSQAEFDRHYALLHDRLEEYDKLYDIYNSYDGIVNLKTLNEKAKHAPVEVDEKIIDLLEYCKYVYELSEGRTNVCLGSVLSIWHNCREKKALPNDKMLRDASKHTDMNDLVIDKDKRTVYFSDPLLKLDVGAVAKGYAAREVSAFAKNTLWSAAMLNIGGNVCTFGYKNNDKKTLWNIEIENPNRNESNGIAIVKITDLSVVTSGDYQRYFVVDKKKYCHIINPKTLYPSEYISGVSVICKDSALGDALSTTLFNMPVDEGLKLVENMDGVEAVWVDKKYNKTFSSGFEKYIL